MVGASVAQDRFLLAAALNLFALRVLLQVKAKLDEHSPEKPDID